MFGCIYFFHLPVYHIANLIRNFIVYFAASSNVMLAILYLFNILQYFFTINLFNS